MKSIFTSRYFDEAKIVEYPEGFNPEEGIRDVSIKQSCPGYEESVRGVFLSGIHIEHRNVQVYQQHEFFVNHDFPFLKMQFELQGHSHFTSSLKSVMDVEIRGNSHQLFYIPEVRGKLTYPTSRHTLEIKLSLDFLNRIFGGELSALGTFGKAIEENQPALLASGPMFITDEMHRLIWEMENCSFSGIMRKIYLECKVSELLLMQVRQADESSIGCCISKKDIEKLHYVKELIEKNVERPKTILELAEIAGINDYKLKREFKRHFGNTIFGYLTDFRLKKAKELILAGEQIGEVAYRMGYKHQQHFSAAFKRYFGYCPGNLKK